MTKTIFCLEKDEEGIGITIDDGVTGKEIEQGLAMLIKALSDRQRKIETNFKDYTLIRSIELWHRVLTEEQSN